MVWKNNTVGVELISIKMQSEADYPRIAGVIRIKERVKYYAIQKI